PRPAEVAHTRTYDQIGRADFNRIAVRLDLPVFWSDGKLSNETFAHLLFYPEPPPALDAAYDQILAASKAAPPTDKRRALVLQDLDQGRATLVHTDFRGATADDKAFVTHVIEIAHSIDRIYEKMNGAA